MVWVSWKHEIHRFAPADINHITLTEYASEDFISNFNLSSTRVESRKKLHFHSLTQRPIFTDFKLMTNHLNNTFNQIFDNNRSVDQTIDSLVTSGCNQVKKPNRSAPKELGKTKRLMFISSLILGERDDLEIEPLD